MRITWGLALLLPGLVAAAPAAAQDTAPSARQDVIIVTAQKRDEGAGARVLGPYPTEEAARLAAASPTCALLDINLRGGRSFNLAHEFMKKGTPFVFITGYDQDIIPEEFAAIARLQKPVKFRQIVAALGNPLGVPS